MKIKELLESLSEVMNIISEIRINGYHYKDFDAHSIRKDFGLLDELEVDFWRFSVENNDIVLIIHAEKSQDSEEETVSDVLSSICFDDENTIVIYNKTDSKVYDSDEDGIFALCELLNFDVREYVQIHRGKHQIIEIHLKSY